MEIETTLCHMFDCLEDGYKILVGDDGKEIRLCPEHYKICREAINRRFHD